MIERYSRQQMADIWTDQNKYQKWLEIEVGICEAYAQMGMIPAEDLKVIQEKAAFDTKRVLEIEQVTKHDVVAFVNCVSEYVGPASKWIHMGVTSSDILDTSFSALLKEAADLLVEDVKSFMTVLKEKAYQYKMVPAIGRTHGIHAEPVTFGLKMAHFHDEMRRNLERLRAARERVSYGKISGAVGTYAHVPPAVEEYVCAKMGLKPVPISSQIVPRDYYAEFFTTVAIIGSSIERIATEIRHLQRTEVGEAEEAFTKGQTGSSAMPHKRNPIGSENLSGLARLLRGYALTALENIALWHERDISHSSVERIIAPDSTVILDFMLSRLTGLLKNLLVYPDTMKKNLGLTRGLIFSQRLMLELVHKGITREEAYLLVQGPAMRVWQEGLDFPTLIRQDPEIAKHLTPKEIDAVFDLQEYVKHVDYLFQRIFSK